MAKSKKKAKLSAFSRFSKQQLIVALVFILSFGSFGVYTIIRSYAATWTTRKTVSSTWKIYSGQTSSLSNATYPSSAGTYRFCIYAKSMGDPLTNQTSTLTLSWNQYSSTVVSVGSKGYVTYCTTAYRNLTAIGGAYWTPKITNNKGPAVNITKLTWQSGY
jgi:hypothetical protein